MYYQGLGVPQDYKIVMKWWKLSAAQGDADAQFNLGRMYFEGLGVGSFVEQIQTRVAFL
jgi:uncharacterized protein